MEQTTNSSLQVVIHLSNHRVAFIFVLALDQQRIMKYKVIRAIYEHLSLRYASQELISNTNLSLLWSVANLP